MSKNNHRFHTLLHSKPRMCILIIAALVLLVSLWQIVGKPALDAWRAGSVEEDTKSLYYSSASDLIDLLFPSALAEEETETVLPEVHEDFAALYEANPHTIGWLKGGAGIDYPVMYHDNAYYLDHDFYGEESINGTLFVNMFNTLEPRDDVLLIHGHNMKSGAMFGDLMEYEDYEYACANPLFTFRMIDDPADVYYVPVFAFNASMIPSSKYYFDIMRMAFPNDGIGISAQATVSPETSVEPETTPRVSTAFSEYLQELNAVSLWDAPVDVTVEDKLLMLVTCSYYHDDGRFMLVCRQLREDETPEAMLDLYAAQ